jgi:hypothetical protein
MSLMKTWYTPQEVEAKFGIGKEKILEWVEEGVVRSEEENGEVVRVNIDDVQLQSESLLREP